VKSLINISIAIVFIVMGANAGAADAEAGKAKAALCAACHGADGISLADIWPNLKGQKEGYLAKQIKAFRDGDRIDASMQPMVANLTDEDVANLAAYYSGM
jgi:cytochrome c553